jgi:hypothetical protein
MIPLVPLLTFPEALHINWSTVLHICNFPLPQNYIS